MLKKSLLLVSLFTLSACSSLIPATAKYKISDEDTQRAIIESNKMEQCLFPKQYKSGNFSTLSEEERALIQNGQRYFLASIIGSQNLNIIDSDALSKQYAIQQWNKFNHSRPADFTKEWCNTQKNYFNTALKQLKAQIQQQKDQELAKQKQAEKERLAREAYLASPEGQAYLAQQQLIAQQQAYEQQLMAARRAAAQQNDFQNISNIMNNGLNSMAQSMQQRTNAIDQMTQQMQSQGSRIGTGWAPTSGVHWNNIY